MIRALIGLGFLALAGRAQSPAEPQPVAWTLSTAPVNAKPGARFQIRMLARINAGWHLYAEDQQEGGPNALRIWLAEEQPFDLAPSIKWPRSFHINDANFGVMVSYYEGEAAFLLPVISKSGPGRRTAVKVNASYQVCNDRICLPPKTHSFEIELTQGKVTITK